MNNETSFRQHNKERFIIVASVKQEEWESVPFVSLVLRLFLLCVGHWFVGSVCEASSSVFFSDGIPSGISSSGRERYMFGLTANCSLAADALPKKDLEKNSSWEEEGINALCLDWSIRGRIAWRGIDSREEIDLWLLQRVFGLLSSSLFMWK